MRNLNANSKAKTYKVRFVNINPGFINDFGHHFSYNSILKKISDNNNWEYLTLANKSISEKYSKKFKTLNVFDYNTWKLIHDGESQTYYNSFYKNLLDACIKLNQDSDIINVYYMYMSDIRLIPVFLKIASLLDVKRNFFFMNLFHACHFISRNESGLSRINDPDLKIFLENWSDLQYSTNVFCGSDTDIIISAIEEITESPVIRFPMLSNSGFSNHKIKSHDHKRILSILIPSISEDRGVNQIIDLVDALQKKGQLGTQYKLTIRNQSTGSKSIKDKLKLIEDKAYIVHGTLSKIKYFQLFERADIVILPYRNEYFYARTSGSFIDAVNFEIPVITTKDTWLGRMTDTLDNGLCYSENNTHELISSVSKVAQSYDDFKIRAEKARKTWAKFNSNAIFSLIFEKKISGTLSLETKLDERSSKIIQQMLNVLGHRTARFHSLLKILQEIEKIFLITDDTVEQTSLDKNDTSNSELLLFPIDEHYISGLEEVIKRFNSSVFRIRANLTTLNKSLSDKCALLISREDAVRNLKELLNKLKTQLEKRDNAITKLKDKNEKLEKLIQSRNEAISRLKDEGGKSKQLISNRDYIIVKLKDENQKSNQIILNRNEAITRLQDEHNRATQLILNRDNAIIKLKDENQKSNQIILNRNEAITRLNEAHNTAKQMIVNRDDAITRLKDENEQSKLIILNRNEAITRLKEEHNRTKQMIANRDNTILKLKDENEKTKQLIANRDNAITRLKSELETISEQITNRDAAINNLKDVNQKQGDCIYELKEQHNKLENTLEILKSTIDKLNSELANQSAQNIQLDLLVKEYSEKLKNPIQIIKSIFNK